MIALLAWGAWQGIAALREPATRARIAATLTLEGFLGGHTAAAVNHAMAHGLPADPALRAAGGVLRWGLFGSGGPAVRVGCDGWLFLAEELRPWPDAAAAMEERAAALGRLRAKLAGEGVALLVAVVPDKARLEAAQSSAAPRARRRRWRGCRTGWACCGRRGSRPCRCSSPWQAAAPAFWRTDTHWNQPGAAASAAAIAEATATLPLARAEAFRTASAPEEANGPGDLLRLMSLDQVPDALRPAPDRQHQELTEAAGEAAGLLDETPPAEVVLLGSSYSVNANFHGRLQQALASTVASHAKAGGGFAGAAREYFAGTAWREARPKLLVWEIPERVVGQPIGAEEREFLAGW